MLDACHSNPVTQLGRVREASQCPSFKWFGTIVNCLGTEALARLGLRLGGFQLMFQSSLSDGVAFCQINIDLGVVII